jgi:hypothetical protein
MPKRRRSPSLPPYLDGGALPPLRWPERRRPSPVVAQAEAPSLPAGFGDAEPNGGGSRGGWHERVGAALHLAVALILRGYRRGGGVGACRGRRGGCHRRYQRRRGRPNLGLIAFQGLGHVDVEVEP